jgi:hypothetical protein
MAPFEPGMVAATGFHAIMDRRTVARRIRLIQGAEHSMFYNPMWSLLGDLSPGPAGTFFHFPAKAESHAWYLLDQVILRPSLMDALDPSGLRIVGDTQFATPNGRPSKIHASDHFPIGFVLNF